jgi:tetratricopeptide (TPR) repeat protein
MNLRSGLIIVSIILGVSISDMESARSESSKNLLDRGSIKSELGSDAEAIKLFDTALKQNSILVQAYIKRGRSKRNLTQYQAALQDYNQALVLNPRSISAYTGRGITYELLNQKSLKDKDFDRALQITPTDSIEYTDLGFIYSDRRDHQKSIKSNSKAIDLDPSNTRAYNNRAYDYRTIDKKELANVDLNSLIKLQLKSLLASKDFISKKEHSNYLLQISWNYSQIEQYEQAIESTNQGIKLDSTNPGNYYWRGIYYQTQRKYQQAISDYDRAIELDNKSGDSYLYINRAFAKKQLGQKSAALSDYQQALKIAKIEGKVATIEEIQIEIDDLQQEPQRIVIATLLTLLLTGAAYGGLIAIERRNEAKYLAQFQDL